MQTDYQKEIHGLHEFFQAWFGGSISNTRENFSRATRALAPSFVLVSPDGSSEPRDSLLVALRGAYGTRAGGSIWTTDIKVHNQIGALTIVSYQEWQTLGAETTCRQSTVLFGPCPTAPNGIEWLHLREVWITPPE